MRSFHDPQGRPWQAALLNGSYGSVALVFTPLGEGTVLLGELPAANLAEAQQQFAAMDDVELRTALAEARPFGA